MNQCVNNDHAGIKRAILRKYKQAAYSPEGLFAYVTGAAGARTLGYEEKILEQTPSQIVGSFCGVGNPPALGAIAPGENLLDVGCGSGFDLFVAGRQAGLAGKLFGIDPTPEMVTLAAGNIAQSGIKNIGVCHGESESIPLCENFFDVVISNGVLNLSTRKELSFGEIYRVLKPGGRLQFADIVLAETLPQEIAGSLEAWSN